MNTDCTSDNTNSDNKDDVNRTTTNTNAISATNSNNLLISNNNNENNKVNMNASDTVINAFVNNEGRIVGMVEENIQTAAAEGPPAQGHPHSPNDAN